MLSKWLVSLDCRNKCQKFKHEFFRCKFVNMKLQSLQFQTMIELAFAEFFLQVLQNKNVRFIQEIAARFANIGSSWCSCAERRALRMLVFIDPYPSRVARKVFVNTRHRFGTRL